MRKPFVVSLVLAAGTALLILCMSLAAVKPAQAAGQCYYRGDGKSNCNVRMWAPLYNWSGSHWIFTGSEIGPGWNWFYCYVYRSDLPNPAPPGTNRQGYLWLKTIGDVGPSAAAWMPGTYLWGGGNYSGSIAGIKRCPGS